MILSAENINYIKESIIDHGCSEYIANLCVDRTPICAYYTYHKICGSSSSNDHAEPGTKWKILYYLIHQRGHSNDKFKGYSVSYYLLKDKLDINMGHSVKEKFIRALINEKLIDFNKKYCNKSQQLLMDLAKLTLINNQPLLNKITKYRDKQLSNGSIEEYRQERDGKLIEHQCNELVHHQFEGKRHFLQAMSDSDNDNFNDERLSSYPLIQNVITQYPQLYGRKIPTIKHIECGDYVIYNGQKAIVTAINRHSRYVRVSHPVYNRFNDFERSERGFTFDPKLQQILVCYFIHFFLFSHNRLLISIVIMM